MDALAILDKLDTYVSECSRLPLVGRLLVDEDEVFNLIDDLRAALPQELEQAKWLLKERDRILLEARKEADEIVRDAQGQIAALASESAIAKEARVQAEDLMSKARDVAREINSGARQYADGLMQRVEEVLSEVQSAIRQGRQELSGDTEAQKSPGDEGSVEEDTIGRVAATAVDEEQDYDDWVMEDPAPPRGKRRRG